MIDNLGDLMEKRMDSKCELESREIRKTGEIIQIWKSPSGIRFMSIHLGKRLISMNVLSLPSGGLWEGTNPLSL